MIWFFIIISIIGFSIWKFIKDSKEIEHRNTSLGGMKKMFPEFIEYFENNNFELVENSGSKLLYKLKLTENELYNKYLFIGIESKFTNIAFGYLIMPDGSKIDGINVEFYKNYRVEEIDMIIRKITGQMIINGLIE